LNWAFRVIQGNPYHGCRQKSTWCVVVYNNVDFIFETYEDIA